jgi:hypothetical protein
MKIQMKYFRKLLETNVLWLRPKNPGNKRKKSACGLQQIKKLLHSKENNQHSEETACRMRENICKLFI